MRVKHLPITTRAGGLATTRPTPKAHRATLLLHKLRQQRTREEAIKVAADGPKSALAAQAAAIKLALVDRQGEGPRAAVLRRGREGSIGRASVAVSKLPPVSPEGIEAKALPEELRKEVDVRHHQRGAAVT